jgi:hypothetical protein
MATSDGIGSAEWDVVHELAVKIVNAPDVEKSRDRQQLLAYLAELEGKYGPLPSILATRADYIDTDDPARQALLLRAHATANARGDTAYLLSSAQSLAELFLEKGRLREADQWLTQMREHLNQFAHSDTDYSVYEELRAEYRKLAIRPAQPPAD